MNRIFAFAFSLTLYAAADSFVSGNLVGLLLASILALAALSQIKG